MKLKRIGAYGVPATLAAALLTTGLQTAHADGFDDWLKQDTMTGDWGGARKRLEDQGIKISGDYVSEVSGNPSGGDRHGTRYAHEIALSADFDLEKMDLLQGGALHFIMTERAGRSLSADDIHNILTTQEIYGSGETIRFTKLSYEQKLFGGAVDIEGGRVNVEDDFAASPTYFGGQIYCDFQSNAICGTPVAAPINSGYTAYPISTWGGRVKVWPVKDWYLETGAYQVNPSLNSEAAAWKLDTSGSTGAYIPVETGVRVGDHPGGWTGNYRIGGYYDTSPAVNYTGYLKNYLPADSPTVLSLPMQMKSGRYGFWVLADQLIQRDDPSNKKGIAAFAVLQWGDPRSSLIQWYAEGGLERRGTFAGRDDDSVALGFAEAKINNRLAEYEGLQQAKGSAIPGQSSEMVVEANYGAEVTPWLFLRGGVQYIFHPRGEDEIPNATVLDLKTTVTF